MTLTELGALIEAGVEPVLEIHGLDPMLYVVYRIVDGRPQALCDARGTMQFRSRYAAQRALAECGATTATFIHRSAYGEMVGLDTEDSANELRETVFLSRD
jgi:hypothetical protein